MPEQKVELTFEQLKELMIEAKKPAPLTPEEIEDLEAKRAERAARKAAFEQDQNMRKENAALALAKLENTKHEQAACSHFRDDGTTSCVYIWDQSGDYLICQQCRGQIHPEPRPTGRLGKETEHHIYNTLLWNTHVRRAQKPATTF